MLARTCRASWCLPLLAVVSCGGRRGVLGSTSVDARLPDPVIAADSGTSVPAPPRADGASPEPAPSWQVASSPTTECLNDIWGSSSTDVWAVGGDWIVGQNHPNGVLLHYDGAAWTLLAPPSTSSLTSIWGSSSKDIWVVGINGTIAHYDGSGWSTYAATSQHLRSVSGTSKNDVWMVGDNGTVLHWDGQSLAPLPGPAGSGFHSVWGTPGQLMALDDGGIVSFAGGSWSVMAPTSALWTIWGRSAQDVWAVGDSSTAWHYDGATWTQSFKGNKYPFYDVWASSATDVWTVSWDKIWHYDGSSWSVAWTSMTSSAKRGLMDIWGSSATDIWAVGKDGMIVRYH
jgi:hypothetical protein